MTETEAASREPTLREAMRQLGGGVCIITVGEGSQRAGFTASSVTSLTLDPPCLLLCINRQASAWPVIQLRRRFCVNILSDAHHELASRFAGIGGFKGASRFERGDWRQGPNGTPVLTDALAAVECDLEDAVERHSHMILIGAVKSIRIGSVGLPLIYGQGGFGRFDPLPREPSAG